MKADKDTLLKHHFWLLLGGFALLWVVGLALLLFGAPAAIKKEKEDYEKNTKVLSSFSRPKNPSFLTPWEAYTKKFQDHKAVVWLQAWNVQKGLISWPSTSKAPLQGMWLQAPSFQDFKKQFDSEGTTFNGQPYSSTAARTDYKETLYLQQFEGLEKLIAPAEFKGGQLGFEQIMAPLTGPPDTGVASGMGGGMSDRDISGGGGRRRMSTPAAGFGQDPNAGGHTIKTLFEKTPTVEECLIAQEDYCVKLEMLKIISRSLDAVAKLKEEVPLKPDDKKDDDKKPNVFMRRRFRNDSWEIDLLFEKDQGRTYVSGKSTIANVDPGKRVLLLANPFTKGGIQFALRDNKAEFMLTVKGEPLPWRNRVEFRERSVIDNIDPTKPFTMQQVFDWSIAPIRRVDEIVLGANSHRTANIALKPNPAFLPEGGDQPPPGPPGPGGARGMSPSAPGPAAMSPPGPPGAPGAAGPEGPAPTTQENGLTRNRYLFVTEQCRHLPFGLVVVLDQNHVHDLLAALANSPLRIQITQIYGHHVQGIQSSQVEPGDPTAAPTSPAASADIARPRRPRSSMSPGMPAFQPGNQQQPTGGDPNLLELTVYGVLPLYERFTDKKPDQPGQSAPPAPPGPPGRPPK